MSNAQNAAAPRTLVLYHFRSCPFCIMVHRKIEQLGLDIEQRNIREEPAYRQELIQGGGKQQVPCLHITESDGQEHWLYESSDINRYLEQHYG
ncbi:glutaredoxin family protein [Carnimonas nigrificans]|uniref:glutaredoxin family protein n=1 Tax=Carnimonas nigrificans TaxID=64323 RepID=UPI00046FC51E|nr:glutaredoxin domain-containing protein [Carnimonas nigrificans]